MTIEIRPEPLGSSVARALILELNEELDQRYPEDGANHFRLDEGDVAPGRGVFLAVPPTTPARRSAAARFASSKTRSPRWRSAARRRPRSSGCSWPERRADAASDGRCSGRSRRPREELGVTQLVLETGERQHEAVGLYERAGFVRIERFGASVSSPLSLCMGKSLDVLACRRLGGPRRAKYDWAACPPSLRRPRPRRPPKRRPPRSRRFDLRDGRGR